MKRDVSRPNARLAGVALLWALGCTPRGGTSIAPGADAEVDADLDAATIDATGLDVPTVDVPTVDSDAAREGRDVDDVPSREDRPGEDVSTVDAGRPARDPQPLYGPCARDAECVSGLRCRSESATGFPSGQCNRECTLHEDCMLNGPSEIADGYCLPVDRDGHRYCARVCGSGADCGRDGYTCLGINPVRPDTANICIPVCTGTSCGDGTVCDLQSGRCRAATAPPPAGRTLGQSCLADNDPASTPATVCQSGLCSPQVVRDAAGVPVQTGSNGGYCYRRCIIPRGYNRTTVWTGSELPRGNCPEGAVCFPVRTLAEGDVGNCFVGCAADSDCRVSEGYTCRRTLRVMDSSPRTFARGFCAPFDCAATDAPACPAGYTCRRTTTGTITTGNCVPAGA